jgi:hypothetical protein
MSLEEFKQEIKENPRLMLHIILTGNREGVIRTLKAYQIPVDENWDDDRIVEQIIESSKKCKLCLVEIMTLRINMENLPEGYPEALEAADMLHVTKQISGAKSGTRFGTPTFDRTTYQGPTVSYGGILYTWNDTLQTYVATSDTGNNSDTSTESSTSDEDPRINWNNVLTGGFAAITSVFSSGVFSGNNNGQNFDQDIADAQAAKEQQRKKNIRNIGIGVGLLVLVIVIVYIIKNRG